MDINVFVNTQKKVLEETTLPFTITTSRRTQHLIYSPLLQYLW